MNAADPTGTNLFSDAMLPRARKTQSGQRTNAHTDELPSSQAITMEEWLFTHAPKEES